MTPLKEQYGDIINIRYFNVGEDEIDTEVFNYMQIQNFSYPMLFINGEIVSSNYVSYYDIVMKINRALNATDD